MPPARKSSKSKPKRASKRLLATLTVGEVDESEQVATTDGKGFTGIKGIVRETPNSWEVNWANTDVQNPGPGRSDSDQITQAALDHWNNLKVTAGAIEVAPGTWEKVEPFLEYDEDHLFSCLEQIFELGMENKEHEIKSIDKEAYVWAAGNTDLDPKTAMLDALKAIKEGKEEEFDDAELKYAIVSTSSFSTMTLSTVKALENHPFSFHWDNASQAATFYLHEALDDDYMRLHQSCVALLLFAPHIAGGQSATSVLLALLISKEDAKDTLWGKGKEDIFGNWKSLCIRWFGQKLKARGVGDEQVRALEGAMAALSAVMRNRVRRAKLAVERD